MRSVLAYHPLCWIGKRLEEHHEKCVYQMLGIGETKCAVANFAWFATGSARLTSNSTQTLRPVATSCSIASAFGA